MHIPTFNELELELVKRENIGLKSVPNSAIGLYTKEDKDYFIVGYNSYLLLQISKRKGNEIEVRMKKHFQMGLIDGKAFSKIAALVIAAINDGKSR